jgi:hypothetical protein
VEHHLFCCFINTPFLTKHPILCPYFISIYNKKEEIKIFYK